MLKAKSVYKIPDGKLLKVFLTWDESSNQITKVLLQGDFFIHPESGIEEIEKALVGCALSENFMVSSIERVVSHFGMELFGVNSQGIAYGILLAKAQAEEGQKHE